MQAPIKLFPGDCKKKIKETKSQDDSTWSERHVMEK